MQSASIEGLRMPGRAADPRAHARDVAGQFEQLFVRTMVQDLRKTSQFGGDGDALFGDGPGADTYAEWFDDNLSAHIAKNGHIGIADTLMRDFERWHQIPPAPPTQRRLPTALPVPGGLDVAA